jgi:hypothetical protein
MLLDSRTLSVGGIPIDYIVSLGEVLDFTIEGDFRSSGAFERISSWYKEVSAMARGRARHLYPWSQVGTGDAIWRAIIGNKALQQHPAPAIYGEYYSVWNEAQPSSAVKMAEHSKDMGVPDQTGFMSKGRALHAFLSALTGACHTRRFCITRQGYMALVPPLTQMGDEISLFVGAQTPFVHRRDKNTQVRNGVEYTTHQVVREAYVH